MKLKIFDTPTREQLFDDHDFWEVSPQSRRWRNRVTKLAGFLTLVLYTELYKPTFRENIHPPCQVAHEDFSRRLRVTFKLF